MPDSKIKCVQFFILSTINSNNNTQFTSKYYHLKKTERNNTLKHYHHSIQNMSVCASH